jgi:hypothetical protein
MPKGPKGEKRKADPAARIDAGAVFSPVESL